MSTPQPLHCLSPVYHYVLSWAYIFHDHRLTIRDIACIHCIYIPLVGSTDIIWVLSSLQNLRIRVWYVECAWLCNWTKKIRVICNVSAQSTTELIKIYVSPVAMNTVQNHSTSSAQKGKHRRILKKHNFSERKWFFLGEMITKTKTGSSIPAQHLGTVIYGDAELSIFILSMCSPYQQAKAHIPLA